jgi:hypothetical protein
MNLLRVTVLGLACALPVLGFAQWQWIDKDGRKVFSDRAPPLDIPEKSILKQPGGQQSGRTAPHAVPSENAAEPTAATPRLPASAASGKDKELEEKKAQADAAEAAKKKAEEEKLAKAKAENCTRARQAKSTFDSGRPLMHTNAQGERGFLDEATRTAESKRLDGIIASDCAK